VPWVAAAAGARSDSQAADWQAAVRYRADSPGRCRLDLHEALRRADLPGWVDSVDWADCPGADRGCPVHRVPDLGLAGHDHSEPGAWARQPLCVPAAVSAEEPDEPEEPWELLPDGRQSPGRAG